LRSLFLLWKRYTAPPFPPIKETDDDDDDDDDNNNNNNGL
jgi:hypothetical protein